MLAPVLRRCRCCACPTYPSSLCAVDGPASSIISPSPTRGFSCPSSPAALPLRRQVLDTMRPCGKVCKFSTAWWCMTMSRQSEVERLVWLLPSLSPCRSHTYVVALPAALPLDREYGICILCLLDASCHTTLFGACLEAVCSSRGLLSIPEAAQVNGGGETSGSGLGSSWPQLHDQRPRCRSSTHLLVLLMVTYTSGPGFISRYVQADGVAVFLVLFRSNPLPGKIGSPGKITVQRGERSSIRCRGRFGCRLLSGNGRRTRHEIFEPALPAAEISVICLAGK